MRKRKADYEKKFLRLVLFFLLVLLVLGLGRRIFSWFQKGGWNGKSQIGVAIETKEKKILILLITPEKNTIGAIILPENLEVETPWFGQYRAGKLSLLAKQEKSPEVFNRSLGFFLGLAIEKGLTDDSFAINGNLETGLAGVFFPPRSFEDLRLWQFLKKSGLAWKKVDLADFSERKELPDGTEILTIEPQILKEEIKGFLTDPLIKEENLSIGVFNLSDYGGLAQKTAEIIISMGGRVIEIGDRQADQVEDCLLIIKEKNLAKTATVKRLEGVFGCQKELARKKEGEEIQLLIRSVKID